MRRVWGVCILLILAAEIAACRSGPSIEEARDIAFESNKIPFVLPARNLNDLRRQYKHIDRLFGPCDGSHVRELKLRMAEKTLSPRHGSAAYRHNSKLMNLSNEAFMLGLHEDSIALAHKVVDAFKGYSSNDAGFAHYMLARFHAFRGDPASARAAMRRGDSKTRDILTGGVAHARTSPDWVVPYAGFHYHAAAGSIAHMTGGYQKAESHYQRAIQESEEFEKHAVIRPLYMDPDLLLADLADVLARQGRLVEAEIKVRSVLKRLKFAYHLPDKFKIAYFLRQLADILFRQGRQADASWAARTSVFVYDSLCASKGSVFVAHAKKLLAQTLIADDRYAEAVDVFESIRADLAEEEPEVFGRLFQNNPLWALSLLEVGRTDEALRMLQAVVPDSDQPGHRGLFDAAAAKGVLAMALRQNGEVAESLAAFEQSIPALLSVSAREGRAHKDMPFRKIMESCMELHADLSGTDAGNGLDIPGATFEMAQWLRTSSTQRALSAGSARDSVKNPGLSELIRREQDITHRMDALKRHTLNRLSSKEFLDAEGSVSSFEGRLEQLTAARRTLLREIEGRFPEYAQVMAPKPVSFQQIRDALRPDEAFIAVYPTARWTFVWAVPSTGKTHFAVVRETGREDLHQAVVHLRRALSPDPTPFSLGDIPAFDCHQAHALYETALLPVRNGWRDRKHLIIVATGPLGPLPFAVLPTRRGVPDKDGNELFDRYRSVHWLIRTASITRQPSAASFVSSRNRKAASIAGRPFIGFGDPIFHPSQETTVHGNAAQNHASVTAPREAPIAVRGIRTTKSGSIDDHGISSIELGDLNRLPDTAEEITRIAQTMGANPLEAVYLGKRASEEVIKSLDLSDRRVIAFASHALNPHDLDGLDQPAIALTSPKVTGEEEDGLLKMGEVLGLHLNAEWVILSACNTGSGEGRGAEAVSGLGKAFFYAGARALLVTMWPVETVSARRLTTTLFRLQQEQEPIARAEALRRSMLALMEAPGEDGFAYAHPIFWAPFVIVGNGG